MNDLIEDDGPGGANAPEFSVSELSGAVKRTVEGAFSHVRVRGEVGRLTVPRSGHVYLDLKDDRAVLASVIWKGVAGRLAHRPEEGMEVIATGRLTTFPGQSRYQLVIEDLRPAGAGALMAMLEKRKAALAAEGLFDADRKAPLPYLPEVIGVVTSPTGAVIRDILHRLRDRFPRKVLIWPVAVQGERCAPEVTRAIRGFNALTPGGALPRPDLLIVARGGGSLEDLWGFNDEAVVRAAAESAIPLISAVGHETDTTLIDYASDHRAPTPTAAAERAVPVRADLLSWLRQQDGLLTRAATQGLATRGQRLRDLSRALPRVEALLEPARQRLDLAAVRLTPALRHSTAEARARLERLASRLDPALERSVARRRLELERMTGGLSPARLRARIRDEARRLHRLSPAPDAPARRLAQGAERLAQASARLSAQAASTQRRHRDRLTALDRLLTSLGYEQTLARGYTVVRRGDAVITAADGAKAAGAFDVQFADGRVAVAVTERGDTNPKTAAKKKTPSGKAPMEKPGDRPPESGAQGRLF